MLEFTGEARSSGVRGSPPRSSTVRDPQISLENAQGTASACTTFKRGISWTKRLHARAFLCPPTFVVFGAAWGARRTASCRRERHVALVPDMGVVPPIRVPFVVVRHMLRVQQKGSKGSRKKKKKSCRTIRARGFRSKRMLVGTLAGNEMLLRRCRRTHRDGDPRTRGFERL